MYCWAHCLKISLPESNSGRLVFTASLYHLTFLIFSSAFSYACRQACRVLFPTALIFSGDSAKLLRNCPPPSALPSKHATRHHSFPVFQVYGIPSANYLTALRYLPAKPSSPCKAASIPAPAQVLPTPHKSPRSEKTTRQNLSYTAAECTCRQAYENAEEKIRNVR